MACKNRQEHYPFCEVTTKPTYASEHVATEKGDPDRNDGDLRMGSPNDRAEHCWVFAEFALLHNRTGAEGLKKIDADVAKLKRGGWKKSAALLIVVAASRSDILTEWAEYLAGFPVWNQPALTDPYVLPLSGGGSVVVKAFDIKLNPTDTLRLPGRLSTPSGICSPTTSGHGLGWTCHSLQAMEILAWKEWRVNLFCWRVCNKESERAGCETRHCVLQQQPIAI